MGYDDDCDDVLTLVHEGPSDGMSIAIFGPIKSLTKMARVPSRIPISIINPYHERERERYKREREVEYPTRDKDRDNFYGNNFDIRYFKKLKDRIQSSYSCNQHLCPMMKQRLEKHQMESHRHRSHQGHDIDSETVILQTASKHRSSTKSGQNLKNTNSMHTYVKSSTSNEIKLKKCNNYNNESNLMSYYKNSNNNNNNNVRSHDRSNNCTGMRSNNDCNTKNDFVNTSNIYNNKTELMSNNEYKRNNINKNGTKLITDNLLYNNSNNKSDTSIPLKRTDTREVVTPKRNIYKDYVQNEVTEWLQEVPIYSNLEQNSNINKDNIINDLTAKIYSISSDNNSEEYERKVKLEIENFLSGIPMWYPGPKREQDTYKDKLNENLFNRIKDLNKKMQNNTQIKPHGGCSRLKPSKNFRTNKRYSMSSSAEEEINKCVSLIKLKLCCGMQTSVDKQEIAKALILKVTPLLQKPINSCYGKLILKCAIVEVLNDLPITGASKNKEILLHRFADDLSNRLLSIQAKFKQNNIFPNAEGVIYYTNNLDRYSDKLFNNIILVEIKKCLANTRFAHHDDVKISITKIFMDYIDSTVSVEEYDIRKDIIDVLKGASNIPDSKAVDIAQNIIINVKKALNQTNKNEVSNINHMVTRNISVYTSYENCCPVTSTPKKKKQESAKLNLEELEYEKNVGNLIRAWMETLPEQFNAPDEKEYKETIIKDLAGDITDEAKLEQLVTVEEKEKWMKYLVYRWLHKLDVFDLEEIVPQIDEFLEKVKEIPVPILTRPQCGNRQAMANIKHMESEVGYQEYFVPKGKDILEDEISIWMNEQSDIFNTDRNSRNNKINELADVVQNKLINKRSEKEISKDVAQWLSNIVKPEQKANVGELADNLKGRIINLPQDATLAANRDKKIRQRAEYYEEKSNSCCQSNTIKTTDTDTVNTDKTMQQFIAKFIEHNYDVDDPMARGAFSHLLKTKLQRLNPPTRKEVYDNFTKPGTNDPLSRTKLIKELDYIKDISDWLKNIPIEASYNKVGNRERIDFVIDLAKNIFEVEEQREADPEAMDYNMYMASIISQFLIQLPLIKEYRNEKNMLFMIDQLIGKIIVHRNKNQQTNDSIDTSGVHSENIGDFIEEFIRINGSEIADDEVKIEAWSARLINEIKKMVRENAGPTVLSKAHVYNRLTNVPMSGDESIKQFDNEFEYIKEISEWLKNLPLLPIDKTEKEERIKMICELTEKITERDNKKINNPHDTNAEAEFANYVSKWIADLSLDASREVIAAVVIQQLNNRIERVKMRQNKSDLDFTNTMPLEKKDSKISKKQSKSMKSGKTKQIKNPAGVIVDSIEKWSASLPIKGDDKIVKTIKDDATKKLFQTVGELSIDPRIYNDDLLFEDVLADEVDSVIEKLPENTDLQKNKEKLRNDLVQNIVEAHKAIKENSAGEHYKHKLENTIEASIPHPVKVRKAFDPGFEIYKTRLADMFILENFDHANDAVKMKYERRVKEQIDKYYDSVKNKNAIPLTKDEIYTELYSALFKVPIPNEASVIGEVEEIKTRCEIDTWFEELPLKPANDLTELLERDKILATLAKRIHQIEKTESKPADKIHKEIMKWLVKLPLLHDQNGNIEQFAKKLQDTLKSSADQRKCLATEPKTSKSKKGKTKVKSKAKNVKDDSQVPGPSRDEVHRQPKKKAAEIVIEIVETWCSQLPIYASTKEEEENAQMMKDNLCTKIIIKISEINMSSETFNDEFQYDGILDEELDKLLSMIPTCCNFEESKAARKLQLINAIKSVKPLFREEKAKHQYKQDLDKTVAKVLGKPQETTAEKNAKFNELKVEIVENFVQFNYDKEDDEGRQAYKIKVHDAVVNFLSNVVGKDKSFDPLIRRNQLLCELTKIPVPSEDVLKEEVEEIRMKNEINELFDDLSISDSYKDKNKLNQVKTNLAKKLNDIELNGHSSENELKMKQEILKHFKKLNKDVKQDLIDDFVNKLKGNEAIRRSKGKVDSCRNTCEAGGVCPNSTPETEGDNKFQNAQNLQTDNKNSKKNYTKSSKKVDKMTKKHTSPSRKSESKTNAHCECSKMQGLDNTKQKRDVDSQEESSNDECDRCVYGEMMRGKRGSKKDDKKKKKHTSPSRKSKSKTNLHCECSKMQGLDNTKQKRDVDSQEESLNDVYDRCVHEEMMKGKYGSKKDDKKTKKQTSPSRKSDSNTILRCECLEMQSLDKTEQERNIDSQDESSNDEYDRCVCGKMRGKYYMPMSWFCNGSDNMPLCMPAGFFYY